MNHRQISGRQTGANVVRRELRQVVKEIVDRLDPIGLLARGCPDNEYVPEIERIVQLLQTKKALSLGTVQSILHETFVEFFDPEIAGSRDRYREAAAELVRRLDALCY